MNSLQNSSGVCPKVTTVNLRFAFPHYLFFKSHRHHCCFSSKRGMERCRIGATLHFPNTNAKSAEYSFGFERRYATAHIVSSDASANTCSSHLSLAVLKYLLSMLFSATSGSWSFHLRNPSSSLGSTELSQCCPFLV